MRFPNWRRLATKIRRHMRPAWCKTFKTAGPWWFFDPSKLGRFGIQCRSVSCKWQNIWYHHLLQSQCPEHMQKTSCVSSMRRPTRLLWEWLLGISLGMTTTGNDCWSGFAVVGCQETLNKCCWGMQHACVWCSAWRHVITWLTLRCHMEERPALQPRCPIWDGAWMVMFSTLSFSSFFHNCWIGFRNWYQSRGIHGSNFLKLSMGMGWASCTWHNVWGTADGKACCVDRQLGFSAGHFQAGSYGCTST